MIAPDSLKGQLLLALPGIGDPRFERSAILLCAHDEEGALGVGVGRTAGSLRFHGLLRELGIDPGAAPDPPLLFGGPVEPGRGSVLHTPDWDSEGTLAISETLALTGTRDVLQALAEGRGQRRWLATLGYAGWGAGQLDEEITGHGWFTTPADERLLFDTPAEERWREAYASVGVDVRMLASGGGRA